MEQDGNDQDDDELGSGQRQLLIFAVLSLKTSFKFLDGLPGFDGSGAGYRTNNTCGSGQLVPIHLELRFGFH